MEISWTSNGCLISTVKLKFHETMEVRWMSNGDLSDFHHGNKIP